MVNPAIKFGEVYKGFNTREISDTFIENVELSGKSLGFTHLNLIVSIGINRRVMSKNGRLKIGVRNRHILRMSSHGRC